MKSALIGLILCLCPILALTQDFNVTTVTPLDPTVFETSGLIMVDGRLITHNDSGGGHYLYEIDQVDGEVIRTVVVANASNVDWEDLCYDENYLYVGEFGNNAGSRTDLKIYRISLTEYLTTPDDTVYCDTIQFSYADQTDFEPAPYTSNYDAEAFIAYNDSLYIFTKNWGNYKTNIYSVPKEIGSHSVSIVDSLNTEGLITGAAYDPEKNEVLLTGYTFTTPFLYFIKGFEGNEFSEGNLARSAPGFEGSIQIEGVCALGNHSFYVSSENEGETDSFLHQIDVSNFIGFSGMSLPTIKLYPNPTQETVKIEHPSIGNVYILSSSGELIATSHGNTVPMSHLPKGIYLLKITNTKGEFIGNSRIIKE